MSSFLKYIISKTKQNINNFAVKSLKNEILILTNAKKGCIVISVSKLKQKEVKNNMCNRTTFDYSKLKGRIIEKFGTQYKFAKANNISDRSMSLKLKNEIGLSQDEILRWCNLLEIEKKEIPLYFFTQKVSNLKQ